MGILEDYMRQQAEARSQAQRQARQDALLAMGMSLLGTRKGQELEGLGKAGLLGLATARNTNIPEGPSLRDMLALQEYQSKQDAAAQAQAQAAALQGKVDNVWNQNTVGADALANGQGPTPANAAAAAQAIPVVEKYRKQAAIYAQNQRPAEAKILLEAADKMEEQFGQSATVGIDPTTNQPVFTRWGNRGGQKLVSGVVPPPDTQIVNTGGSQTVIDKLRTAPGTTFTNTMTPGEKASNALGWANYGLSKEAGQRAAAAAARETAGSPGLGPLTPGQKAVDSAFAKEYVDFKATGGIADTNKQTAQLREAARAVKKEGLSGPVIGSMPDSMLAFNETGQKAMAVRDAVLEVGQRNLRLVLGTQFTQREGEMLLSRIYNPRLPPEENERRILRLSQQIEQAARAKQDAANYFEKNGTLAGWNGKIYTLSDFDPDKQGGATGGWSVVEEK